MSHVPSLYFSAELVDGTTIGPVRIYAADKIRAESTATTQGWKWADNPRIHSLMGYYAAKRTGDTIAENYKEFMEGLIDFAISNSDGSEHNEDEDDPTKADTSDF